MHQAAAVALGVASLFSSSCSSSGGGVGDEGGGTVEPVFFGVALGVDHGLWCVETELGEVEGGGKVRNTLRTGTEGGVLRGRCTYAKNNSNHTAATSTPDFRRIKFLHHPSNCCASPSPRPSPSPPSSSSPSTYQLTDKEEAPRNCNHDRAHLPAHAQRLVKPIHNKRREDRVNTSCFGSAMWATQQGHMAYVTHTRPLLPRTVSIGHENPQAGQAPRAHTRTDPCNGESEEPGGEKREGASEGKGGREGGRKGGKWTYPLSRPGRRPAA